MNSEPRNGVLYISGEVTVKTVTGSVYAKFEQQCRLNDITAVDFSAVSRADSACVSLLLTALRLKPQQIELRHIPESVKALAELYDIKDWVFSS
ncbi:STAS domain-containing protein [Neisseria perflava]|uniref:STAS domain-containing protein n=1 Tax=Neisseria perflava TaxID=33053 RepID=UPI0020A15E59|nr:STAS domain-containing protein [Neisseria perflava]MCP1660512.1 phospholipid transport system transporter-binding protein [Neisseria perflava]MCP1772063.1 phospholipid transport system transporter-binding protein [Neisseria perflava]